MFGVTRDGKLFLQRHKFEDEELTPAFVTPSLQEASSSASSGGREGRSRNSRRSGAACGTSGSSRSG